MKQIPKFLREIRNIYGNVIIGTEFRKGEFGTLYNTLTGSRDTRGKTTLKYQLLTLRH